MQDNQSYFAQITCKSRCCTKLSRVCFRIGRKKTTVLGVVVSFIASVVAVLFQRDLKNTGTLLYKSVFFTITAEIHARSLATFNFHYADRHINLKFMRRVSERERAIGQFVIVKKQIDVRF